MYVNHPGPSVQYAGFSTAEDFQRVLKTAAVSLPTKRPFRRVRSRHTIAAMTRHPRFTATVGMAGVAIAPSYDMAL